ncbi:PLP-dependent aminotransferase family protein [Microbacterium sp.]|uniref:aminotransferase-like domain-containing protein n=1 Tax=Microbacterium sp. TaxID=51671 RepID=UPI003A87CB67
MDHIDADVLTARLGRWVDGGGTLGGRLSRAVAALIESGALPAGVRLPAERALAHAIAVSRGTVVAAYGLLEESGLVVRRQGSGTRVAGHAGRRAGSERHRATAGLLAAAPAGIDLLRAVPRVSPGMTEIIAAHRLIVDPVVHSEGPTLGLADVRSRIAQVMTDDGTPTTAEQIVVTHGAQQALHLAVSDLVSEGDIVLTESTTWPGLTDTVRARGGRVHGIRTGPDGIDLDELEAAVARLRPVLIAVVPHHHNPTGSRMPAPARQRLADVAASFGVPVLEDRALASVSFDGVVPPSLASLRPDAPVLVSESVSKWSWSSLRFGWLRADPATVQRLRTARHLMDLSTSVPTQLLGLDVLAHARPLRREYSLIHAESAEVLRAAVAQWLPDWELPTVHGGLSYWAPLPAGSASALARLAAEEGVSIAGGTEFTAAIPTDTHVRLPFTASHDDLREAARRLGSAWLRYRELL